MRHLSAALLMLGLLAADYLGHEPHSGLGWDSTTTFVVVMVAYLVVFGDDK